MVLMQFSKHYSPDKLIPDYQSAYRANCSCEAALKKIVNDILWVMEHPEVTSFRAFNLGAAFDTVNYNILLSIMEKKLNVHYTCLA